MFRDKDYYRFLELSGLITESNKRITKISFYDFDSTLVKTPDQENGMIEYENKMGVKWPHIGWWSKPETLDYTIFDIKAYDPVRNMLNKDNNDTSVLTCLMTARIVKLKNEIINLLNHLNLKFDIYSLKENNNEKDVRIENYLSMYPMVTDIDIYDDRDKEFALFYPLRDKLAQKNINVNIFKCDKGNITKI